MQKKLGFSLFEMITVLLLMAVVVNFSWGYLRKLYDEHEDDTMQFSLLNAIQYAQRTSLQGFSEISICGSSTQTSCDGEWGNSQLVFLDRDNRGDVVDSGKILFVNHFPQHNGQLYWRSFPESHTDLHFMPQGVISDNGTFWYCHVNQLKPAWAIAINKAGKAHAMHPDQNGDIYDSGNKPLACV